MNSSYRATVTTFKITGLFFLWLLTTEIVHAQNSNQSLSYSDVIKKYKQLDSLYDEAKFYGYGKTDCGESLQLFVISQSKIFDPARIHELNKCMLFINNGIHPGEPDGIDASLKLAEDLLSKPLYKRILENVVVCIIPVFNIDGALERGCCSRANQNGPENYGFRGNAKNLDLNRDFIKADSRNTKSLISILRKWDPDVLIDTHVSDGADYQYTMTLITSQHNKINHVIGDYLNKELSPALFDKMKDKEDEMSPYVNIRKEYDIPDSGITAFLETPRFLSGYAAMFNCFSFISESHMLKPFDKRMKSTYNILSSLTELCNEKSDKIIESRKKAYETDSITKVYNYNWVEDSTKKIMINFKGYEAGYKPSKVTGGQRLYYDRTKPFTRKIPFYNDYKPEDSIKIPRYFLIPQAWEEIVRLLENNGVKIIRINKDSSSDVTVNYIKDYETVKTPYEGHYLHYNVKTKSEIQNVKFKPGDFLIPMPQKNMRFVLETLVPGSSDSYFCWGFFDSFLQQKEGFSSYVYEDVAADLLDKNTKLKNDFTEWKKNNPSSDEYSQLNYIYQHSDNFEKTYNRYPVFMVY